MQDRTLSILTREQVLAGLNKALLAERQAVADYGAHARTCDRPDVQEALRTLQDVEREHALRVAARIAALGGTVDSRTPEPRSGGDALADWLAQDLQAEQWAIVEYARLVAGIVDDDATAELMTELLMDEIRHARWLKSTLRTLQTASWARQA